MELMTEPVFQKKKEDPNNPDLLGLGDNPDAFFGIGGQGDGKVFTLDGQMNDGFLNDSMDKGKKHKGEGGEPPSLLF